MSYNDIPMPSKEQIKNAHLHLQNMPYNERIKVLEVISGVNKNLKGLTSDIARLCKIIISFELNTSNKKMFEEFYELNPKNWSCKDKEFESQDKERNKSLEENILIVHNLLRNISYDEKFKLLCIALGIDKPLFLTPQQILLVRCRKLMSKEAFFEEFKELNPLNPNIWNSEDELNKIKGQL